MSGAALRNLAYDDVANFKGRLSPTILAGPTRLYRFTDTPDGTGAWWVPEQTFFALQAEARDQGGGEFRATLFYFKDLMRRYLAVSLDWNQISKCFAMNVPADARVSGWTGEASRQPIYSTKSPKHDPKGEMLPGGYEQFFVERYDPRWIAEFTVV